MAGRERISPDTVRVGTVIWTNAGAAIVRSVEQLDGRFRFGLHDRSTISFLASEGVPVPSPSDLRSKP
jgi:hypothetical protein